MTATHVKSVRENIAKNVQKFSNSFVAFVQKRWYNIKIRVILKKILMELVVSVKKNQEIFKKRFSGIAVMIMSVNLTCVKSAT